MACCVQFARCYPFLQDVCVLQDLIVLQGTKRLQDNMQEAVQDILQTISRLWPNSLHILHDLEVQETGRSCKVMHIKTVQVLVNYFCLGMACHHTQIPAETLVDKPDWEIERAVQNHTPNLVPWQHILSMCVFCNKMAYYTWYADECALQNIYWKPTGIISCHRNVPFIWWVTLW